MRIPLVGGANEDKIEELGTEICKNLYAVKLSPSGEEWGLKGVPGLKEFCDTSNAAEVRGMCVMDKYLYAVVGNRLYKIDPNGVATYCNAGIDLSKTSGHVYMDVNTAEGDVLELWVSYFDDTYWTIQADADIFWDDANNRWETKGDVGTWTLIPTGGWEVGFRPSQFRLTYTNHPSTMTNLKIPDTNSPVPNWILNESSYVSQTIIDLTWYGYDIDYLRADLESTAYYITNIEFGIIYNPNA